LADNEKGRGANPFQESLSVTDLFPDPGPDWRIKLKRLLLDLDARIDFAVFQSGKWAREIYERFTAIMDHFHIAGWRRWLIVEPLSEAATWGTAGLLLMLALAIPAFRETSDEGWLKKSELAVSFLDRYGNDIGNRGIKHNDSVQLEDMPDHLIKAVLATEDRRFYEHFGIDFLGTFRALLTNAKAGGVVQGGSTITQQLAKNLFLSNERTIERKINEAFLALWLETRLSKNEILKLYLDRAYLGGGAFGVDGAAQYYFGKSVRDVTLPEAAMLAGLFKAPSRFSPLANLPAARARANVVLDNLVDAGFMTEGQVYGARRNPATPIDRREEDAPNYYLDWAFDEMRKLVDTFPKSVNESFFVVRTALDTNLQHYAEREVESASCANTATITAPARRRRWSPISTARCGRWSAGAIMARASSTAPSTRCASPVRRSNLTSTPPRSPTDLPPTRSSSIRRCASAIGARTIIPAAIPVR
jgi:penicillin-binding protein 1A